MHLNHSGGTVTARKTALPARRGHNGPMDTGVRSPFTVVATLALAAGSLIYLFARPASVYALLPPMDFPAWSAALPSFFHTLGFALLCAGVLRVRGWALTGVLAWGALEALAEWAQRVTDGASLVSRGTFDWLDMTAIAAATLVAAVVTARWLVPK